MKNLPPGLVGNPDAEALARCGIVYEVNGFYVLKTSNGFEVYRPSKSGTHAVCCAIFGGGEAYLARAKVKVDTLAANLSTL